MSTQNTIIGILGGVAIGAIAGILMAPDKGSKTRTKIANKAKDVKENISENAGSAMDTITEQVDTIKKAGNEIVDKTKVELSKVQKQMAS